MRYVGASRPRDPRSTCAGLPPSCATLLDSGYLSCDQDYDEPLYSSSWKRNNLVTQAQLSTASTVTQRSLIVTAWLSNQLPLLSTQPLATLQGF